MPALVRLYIRSVLIGFALSAVFVAALLWFNIANLWHLVSTSPQGWVAVAMLFVFNGIIFAGVQFGFVVMRMGRSEGPRGGKKILLPLHGTPAPVKVAQEPADRR